MSIEKKKPDGLPATNETNPFVQYVMPRLRAGESRAHS
jgi:hypothetical protein